MVVMLLNLSHIIHLTLWVKKYIAIELAILLHYEHNSQKVLFYYFQTAISSESHMNPEELR